MGNANLTSVFSSNSSKDGHGASATTQSSRSSTYPDSFNSRYPVAKASAEFNFALSDIGPSNAQRKPLPVPKMNYGDADETTEKRTFMIKNFLSPCECSELIAAAERVGFENLDRTFPASYRQSDRLMIFSQRLARSLFQRLQPHFEPGDIEGIVPMGFGRSGKWVPVRLNECLKIVKYTDGGKISPHQDGPWVPFEGQASIYTLVVYLNENFEGGRTYMCPSGEVGCRELEYSLSCPKITPTQGSAIVFDHRCPHGSEPIYTGTKYILRAEVVFQRVFGSELASPTADACLHYTANPKYLAARALYEESRYHERHGDKEEFVSKYQEVLRMQCEATAEVEGALRANRALRNDTIWVLSLQFLAPEDLLPAMQVDKSMLDVCCRMEIWQPLVLRRWPAAGDHKSTLSPLPPAHCVDWRNIYRLRSHHSKYFSSVVVFVAPDQIQITSKADFNVSEFCECYVRCNVTKEFVEGLGEYFAGALPTAISDIMSSEQMMYSYPFHINMPDYVRFEPREVLLDNAEVSVSSLTDEEVYNRVHGTDKILGYVLEGGEAVNWPTCAAVVRMFTGLQPTQSVLLISGPEGFVRRGERAGHRNKDEEIRNTHSSNKTLRDLTYIFPTDEAIFSFHNVLCTPAVRIEHIGVAALASVGYSFGVFISIIYPSSKTVDKCFRAFVTVVLTGGIVVVNEQVYVSPELSSEQLSENVKQCLHNAIPNAEMTTSTDSDSVALQDVTLAGDIGVVNSAAPNSINNLMSSVPVVVHLMGYDVVAALESKDSATEALRLLCNGGVGCLSEEEFIFPTLGPDPSQDDVVIHPTRLLNAGLVSSGGILLGGTLLSTQADHRSKCTFQPFI